MIRFLFYISLPYSIPICKPLEKVIKSKNMEVKWFVEKEDTNKYLFDSDVLTIQEAVKYNPHIVFTATDSVADFIPGIKVQIFHGFPANKRKVGADFIIRNYYDLYCTQGPSSTSVFKAKSKQLGHFEVVETGWSKMDPLFPLEEIKNNGVKKPVVMISSTFTKRYSLAANSDVFEEIKRLSKLGKWYFEVVLHPLMCRDIVEKFKAIQNEYLTYHDTTDLIPLFKKSDVMLSDTSSALIEFQIQNKPVVTFRNNMPLPSYINILEVSAIEKAIEFALSKPQNIMQEVEKYIKESHPYYDGKSSERVISAALAFLEKDKSYLKSKPLNLIRKYKMRKKLNYFTLKSFNKPLTIKLK